MLALLPWRYDPRLPWLPRAAFWTNVLLRWSAGTAAAVAIALASQAYLWSYFLPFVPSLRARGGYVPEQPKSISSFRFAATRSAIEATGRMCDIDPAVANPRLVVDDLTYLVFRAAYRPMQIWYLLYSGGEGVFTIRTSEEIEALMARAGAGKIIVACNQLPPELRATMKSDGTYCCRGEPPSRARR